KEGLHIEVSDSMSSSEYTRQLGEVRPLLAAVRRLGATEPAMVASALEFILEGLHLNKKLNKDMQAGHSPYRAESDENPVLPLGRHAEDRRPRRRRSAEGDGGRPHCRRRHLERAAPPLPARHARPARSADARAPGSAAAASKAPPAAARSLRSGL